jgi:hypothetical protein
LREFSDKQLIGGEWVDASNGRTRNVLELVALGGF